MNDTAKKHRIKIARQTLRLTDLAVRILGGMTKEEARQILAEARSNQKKKR